MADARELFIGSLLSFVRAVSLLLTVTVGAVIVAGESGVPPSLTTLRRTAAESLPRLP